MPSQYKKLYDLAKQVLHVKSPENIQIWVNRKWQVVKEDSSAHDEQMSRLKQKREKRLKRKQGMWSLFKLPVANKPR